MGIALEMIQDYGFVFLGIIGSIIALVIGVNLYRRRRTSRS